MVIRLVYKTGDVYGYLSFFGKPRIGSGYFFIFFVVYSKNHFQLTQREMKKYCALYIIIYIYVFKRISMCDFFQVTTSEMQLFYMYSVSYAFFLIFAEKKF